MPNCETAPILGVLACKTKGEPPFHEKKFFSRLSVCGAELGLFVYVFSPGGVDFAAGTAEGRAYDTVAREWRRGRFPLPDILYDRWFAEGAENREEYAATLRRLVEGVRVRPLGGTLHGKWAVYRALKRHREFHPYLPETELLREDRQLAERLERNGEAFLKPVNATHGKGTLYAAKLPDARYYVRGRDRTNARVEAVLNGAAELTAWFTAFRGGSLYLIQDYLALTAKDGSAFDVRALAQKNGSGRWSLTGLAVRHGAPGSLTSNLHGGGEAADAAAFLRGEFGAGRTSDIVAELNSIASKLPYALERHFGRLAEIGIDLGVDREGRIWIIEANSKPGRESFGAVGRPEATRNAVYRPAAYAHYLAKTLPKKFHQDSGGYPNEF